MAGTIPRNGWISGLHALDEHVPAWQPYGAGQRAVLPDLHTAHANLLRVEPLRPLRRPQLGALTLNEGSLMLVTSSLTLVGLLLVVVIPLISSATR